MCVREKEVENENEKKNAWWAWSWLKASTIQQTHSHSCSAKILFNWCVLVACCYCYCSYCCATSLFITHAFVGNCLFTWCVLNVLYVNWCAPSSMAEYSMHLFTSFSSWQFSLCMHFSSPSPLHLYTSTEYQMRSEWPQILVFFLVVTFELRFSVVSPLLILIVFSTSCANTL